MTELALPRRTDLPAPGASVFLLGVAGAGMQALARALADAGYSVGGSDRDFDAARAVAGSVIRVVPESDTTPIERAALVVYSSALAEDHPALNAARQAGVATLKRARALGALVNDRLLTAVAGTHGKTTVTAMLAIAAEQAGMDPLALVGGRVHRWGSNTRLGSGRLAVVEADEFDRSFLQLDPDLAIVTSLEAEHLDCYGDVEALRSAFETFTGRAGRLLACADDDASAELGSGHANARSYGFSQGADYRVEVLETSRAGQSCLLYTENDALPFRLGSPGAHNAQNAAAALAASMWLGAPPASLGDSLEDFTGAERRLQVLHESERLVVIDDYAHHPTELKAAMEAVRSAWPARRLTAVFQPHLYTRTRDLAREFADALTEADTAYVLPIYPSRERPIAGVDRDIIVSARRGIRGIDPDEAIALAAREPTVILFMGAGDVTLLAHESARRAGEVSTDALGG